MALTPFDEPEFEMVELDEDDPAEVATMFAAFCELAVDAIGGDNARDLLEAAIALAGAERN